MAVNLETKWKSSPMEIYFMKIQKDKEDRKKRAPPPPPSLGFTGFLVASFDGFQDIPAVNPTLRYRCKELKGTKRKSEPEAEISSRSDNLAKPREISAGPQNNVNFDSSRPRTAKQRLNLKLNQLKESDNLMLQLQMRVAVIKSSKPTFESEKIQANLNVVSSLERGEHNATQLKEKRKNRLLAIVEAARKSESLQVQMLKEMEEKEELRSKAKERYLEKKASMNHQSRQMLLLTVCAFVTRSWWWLNLANKHILCMKNWMKIMKATMTLKKCAKNFLWKLFLKKKAKARSYLITWLPDKMRRWASNRYNTAIRTLKISIKEWLRCNRYKILAKMYLTRMFRIQKAIRFARLRQFARAECNWMILQNHLNSLKSGIAEDEQANEDHEEQQPSSKRLHWLLKIGELKGICRVMGTGCCMEAIMSYLSGSRKAHIRCIDEWKDVCVKKRKLGFKWMPTRPKYKFLMTPKQIELAVIQRAHGLLHEEIMVLPLPKIPPKQRREKKGPSEQK
jgi:hypothetical protein